MGGNEEGAGRWRDVVFRRRMSRLFHSNRRPHPNSDEVHVQLFARTPPHARPKPQSQPHSPRERRALSLEVLFQALLDRIKSGVVRLERFLTTWHTRSLWH